MVIEGKVWGFPLHRRSTLGLRMSEVLRVGRAKELGAEESGALQDGITLHLTGSEGLPLGRVAYHMYVRLGRKEETREGA